MTRAPKRTLEEALYDDHDGDKPREYHYFAEGDLVESKRGPFDGIHPVGIVSQVTCSKWYVVCSPPEGPFTTFTTCNGADLTHVTRDACHA